MLRIKKNFLEHLQLLLQFMVLQRIFYFIALKDNDATARVFLLSSSSENVYIRPYPSREW